MNPLKKLSLRFYSSIGIYAFIDIPYKELPYHIIHNSQNYVLKNLKTKNTFVKSTKRINQPKKIKKGKRNDF